LKSGNFNLITEIAVNFKEMGVSGDEGYSKEFNNKDTSISYFSPYC
jgi:hypothetical protein